MGTRLLATLLLLLLQPLQAQTPYAHSLQTALARTTPGLELLVLDLRNRQTLADTFHHPAVPIPTGSLLKPFLALAYARTHATFPTFTCHGHTDRCWSPHGHGPLGLSEALAQSCNAYFLALSRDLDPTEIPFLPAPPLASTPAILIGLNSGWPIAPEVLAQAYAALFSSPDSAAKQAILAGMRASATHGTGIRIGRHPGGVLTKTGTAPCLDHRCKASGDGLFIAAVPAAHPTLLLLVRERATTGAMTARAASDILTELESLHAE